MNPIFISQIQNAADLELLRGRKSFDYDYDDSTMKLLKRNFKLEDSLYLLAKNGEEFVGFCSMDRGWWEENHFFLREILVAGSYREAGIGTEFMKRCISHAKRKNASGILTETAFDNRPMQHLCAKFGFEKWENPEWKEGITFKLVFQWPTFKWLPRGLPHSNHYVRTWNR